MEICPRWKFTHLTHREALIVAVVMLCVILVDIAGFAFNQDGDIDADGFLASDLLLPSWASSPVFPLLLISDASASIYVLVVVYKGGRTRQKYHNDRTIELVASSFLRFFRRLSFLGAVYFFLLCHYLSSVEKSSLLFLLDNCVFLQKEVLSHAAWDYKYKP